MNEGRGVSPWIVAALLAIIAGLVVGLVIVGGDDNGSATDSVTLQSITDEVTTEATPTETQTTNTGTGPATITTPTRTTGGGSGGTQAPGSGL